MKPYLIIFALSFVLVGCQTTEELAQQDDAICQGYGLEKGSPQYIQCRQFQQADRTARYQTDQQTYALISAVSSISNAVSQNKSNRN